MRWLLAVFSALLLVPVASAAGQIHLTIVEDGFAVTYAPANTSDLVTARLPFDAESYEIAGARHRVAPPPALDATTRIVYVADMGTDAHAQAIVDAIVREAPDLVLVGGDLSYAHADDATWAKWFDIVAPLAQRIPVMPAFGNHEGYCVSPEDTLISCGIAPNRWHERFPLPNGDRLFYGFDWGPARVTVLNTEAYTGDRAYNSTRAEQRDFLNGSLGRNNATWDIVMFHRPLRTTNLREGATLPAQRNDLEPILDKAADLVLQGHLHAYERAKPTVGGTIYVTSGGGGRALYDDWGPMRPWVATRGAEHHFLVLDVSPTRIEGRAVRPEGSSFDTFTLERPAPPTVSPRPSLSPSPSADPSPAEAETPAAIPFSWLALVAALMVSARRSRRRVRE